MRTPDLVSAVLAALTWRYVQLNQDAIRAERQITIDIDLINGDAIARQYGTSRFNASGLCLQIWNRSHHAVKVTSHLHWPQSSTQVVANRVLAGESSQSWLITDQIISAACANSTFIKSADTTFEVRTEATGPSGSCARTSSKTFSVSIRQDETPVVNGLRTWQLNLESVPPGAPGARRAFALWKAASRN